MPAELQQQVHAEVERTRDRSGWPVRRTLRVLGVSASSYYRWLKDQAWTRSSPAEPVRPVQVYEALDEEKSAVRRYACRHPAIRHRELAWRMIDEDVACLSPSTVYRILKEENLVCPWRRRTKRSREEKERAQRPNERWATDLMHLRVGDREYYLVCFLDEYSRYIVHHELLTGMDGQTVSVAAQAALETLPRSGRDGTPQEKPEIRSDNGSCYVSKDFRGVLDEHGLTHQRILPHCPEENGIMERAYRTFREALEGEQFDNLLEAQDVLTRIVIWYNEERLHRALGYLRPVDYYRGDPAELHEQRRRKLAAARHRRRETNLGLRQPTLPLSAGETVPNNPPDVSQSR